LNQKIKQNTFKNIKKFTKFEQEKNNEIFAVIRNKNTLNLKKTFFFLLNRLRKIKKEEELKEDIINKLKSKAKALLGDFG
jgi:hypothetical protein